MSFFKVLLCLCLATCAICGVPNKERVVQSKLSDEEPGSKDYDHDAFLGEEEAKKFEALAPEESKRKLGIIFDKIDEDGNELVSEKELENWITKTHKRYIDEDTKKEFMNYDMNQDKKIEWEEYYNLTFGFLRDEDWKSGEDTGFSYEDMLQRDKKRWAGADLDGDNACTFEEYMAYLHPEEHDHMKDIVMKETVEDMDKDKDGFLSLEEYIGDMYKPESAGEKEPEWVQGEREQFVKHRDTDKDGKLNDEEIRKWILPDDYNHAQAESAHLIHVSDTDKNGHLTKDEMVEHYDVFVGSQATEWGEMLKRHDEF